MIFYVSVHPWTLSTSFMSLANKFSITIKINVDLFLGMQEIFRKRSSKIISLSQPGYISALIDKFKIDITSTISYPNCPMSSLDLLDSYTNISITID